ncbi:MAG: hypothetical protein LBG11_02815 [Bifidobacteriaceae bacterium]|jgi:plasmid stability protein|nr:hypothetical protein [Bifidobacteriaceae bacterium]
MAMITVRNLDEAAKRRLQRRAAANGRSMEAEVRSILESVEESSETGSIVAAMREARQAIGYGRLELPDRIRETQRDVVIR